jgi:hypothetical protein
MANLVQQPKVFSQSCEKTACRGRRLLNADEKSLGNAKKARTISTAQSTLPHTTIQGRLEEFSILELREL